ncbi:NUDIX domain-containing protein [uncultured Maribacter sp.]|uniref:NUDIX hydrolase n=1 Tax=uncultured Maribacter sp. TaxID=431308 RepID=UPI0026205871|nr:NUDIX domain-containing protein [uncultured Maribacter sp.]
MKDEFFKSMNAVISKCLPGNSIDCVVFGYENYQLKTLLLKWKQEDLWSLPGGFIYLDEDLDAAAVRVLKERTGVTSMFLDQFYTFGEKERSKMNSKIISARFSNYTQQDLFGKNNFVEWIDKRFITTGYLALANIEKTLVNPDVFSEKYAWVNVHNLPELLLDHNEIIERALHQLRIQLNYMPIGISLLPEKFTMQDVQKLYEAILQKPLERSNFQRKMLKLDIFKREEKQLTGAANKAPYLYSFNKEKYNELLTRGIGFNY